VIARLTAAATALQDAHPGAGVAIERQRSDAGFATPADSGLVRRLEAMSGAPARSVAFGTEAPQLAQLGAEVAVFGLATCTTPIRTDEYVSKDELLKTVADPHKVDRGAVRSRSRFSGSRAG